VAPAGGRTVTVILLGAARPSLRARDAMNIRRWLAGETPAVLVRAAAMRPRAPVQRARATPGAGPWPATGTLEPAAPIVEPSIGRKWAGLRAPPTLTPTDESSDHEPSACVHAP